MPVETCLREYTSGAAYAQYDEAKKGKLAPGMLADIAVFPSDITHLNPHELMRTQVSMTIVGGRVVYDVSAK